MMNTGPPAVHSGSVFLCNDAELQMTVNRAVSHVTVYFVVSPESECHENSKKMQ